MTPMLRPTMGGEDFSFMLNAKQGSYIMLGGGRGKDDAMVHHPRYDFNDEILPVGAFVLGDAGRAVAAAVRVEARGGVHTENT